MIKPHPKVGFFHILRQHAGAAGRKPCADRKEAWEKAIIAFLPCLSSCRRHERRFKTKRLSENIRLYSPLRLCRSQAASAVSGSRSAEYSSSIHSWDLSQTARSTQ